MGVSPAYSEPVSKQRQEQNQDASCGTGVFYKNYYYHKEEREEKRMRVTVMGVKASQYKGKDGQLKSGYNISGLKDFTRYEMENADCEGQDVVREFTNVNFNVHPGDVVEFIYEPGFQDKATLVDIQIISLADNPFPDKKDAADDKAAGPQGKAAKAGA